MVQMYSYVTINVYFKCIDDAVQYTVDTNTPFFSKKRFKLLTTS